MPDQEKRRRALNVVWPIRDDNPIPLWLVPGNWTRGQAASYVARQEEVPFIRCRVRRAWFRWMMGCLHAGWQLDDGYLVPCARSDDDAESYWEVTVDGV